MRGPPERGTAKRLASELVKDGFVSSGKPVLIHLDNTLKVPTSDGMQAPWQGTLLPLSVAYIKGQARVMTLMCAVTCYLDHWAEATPDAQSMLINAACNIYCYNVDPGPSRRDKLFYNFTLASRGSIRRAPHVLAWVEALTKLKEDPSVIVRKWNAMASTTQQLRGNKAMAVKTVIERMPSSVLSLLLQHVGSCGDYESSALSDGILSTKRIYPGFLFRSTITKDWNLRGRVTA